MGGKEKKKRKEKSRFSKNPCKIDFFLFQREIYMKSRHKFIFYQEY